MDYPEGSYVFTTDYPEVALILWATREGLPEKKIKGKEGEELGIFTL